MKTSTKCIGCGALLAVVQLGAPSRAVATSEHAKIVAQGQELYYSGDYEEALFVLEELAGNAAAPTVTRVESLKFTAFSYFLLGARTQAVDAWRRLLQFNPAFKLNPIEESPEFVTFFGSLVAYTTESAPQQKAPVQISAGPKQINANGPPTEPASSGFNLTNGPRAPVPVRGCGDFLCLIPGGTGQFLNGQLAKGVLFSALQTAFLAGNIAFYWQSLAARDTDNLAEAHDLWPLQTSFLVGLAVSAVVGIVDAYLWYD